MELTPRGFFLCISVGSSVFDYRLSVGRREEMAIEVLQHIPKQLVIFYGPRAYQPTMAKKLSALKSYFQLLKSLLPTDPALHTGHLWHNDLHDENIFVDPENPTKILGIIDWQSVQISPLYDHVMDPSFLGYEGPDIGDNLERPALPEDMDSLSQEEKSKARTEFYDKGIMVAWRTLVKKKNPAQYAAIQFRNSDVGNLLFLARNVFTFGEVHFRTLLLDILRQERNGSSLSAKALGSTTKFSEAEMDEIEEDVRDLDVGVRIMQQIIARVGHLWQDKGVVAHDNYDVVMSRLREEKAELKKHCVQSEEEERSFEELWPFNC